MATNIYVWRSVNLLLHNTHEFRFMSKKWACLIRNILYPPEGNVFRVSLKTEEFTGEAFEITLWITNPDKIDYIFFPQTIKYTSRENDVGEWEIDASVFNGIKDIHFAFKRSRKIMNTGQNVQNNQHLYQTSQNICPVVHQNSPSSALNSPPGSGYYTTFTRIQETGTVQQINCPPVLRAQHPNPPPLQSFVGSHHCQPHTSLRNQAPSNQARVLPRNLVQSPRQISPLSTCNELQIANQSHSQTPTFLPLYKQRNAGNFVDVTLFADGKGVSAHKCVLAAASDIFEGIFTRGLDEGHKIEVENLTLESVEAMIKFIYTNVLDVLSEDVLLDLLSAGELYHIKNLKENSEQMLIPKISIDNALKFFEYSSNYSANFLKCKTLQFIRSNGPAIVGSSTWKNFNDKHKISLCEGILQSIC